MAIATSEQPNEQPENAKNPDTVALGHLGGLKGKSKGKQSYPRTS